MGTLLGDDTGHAILGGFTEKFPAHAGRNKTLGKLAAAYADLYKRRADATAAANEAQARLPQIDLLVGDGLNGSERRALLEERSVLMALLAGYPARAQDLARRCARAHLEWLACLRELAMSEAQKAQGQLDIIEGEGRKVRRALYEGESTSIRADRCPPEVEVVLKARLAELAAQAAPLRQCREWALAVVKVADARADNLYATHRNSEGADVQLARPGSWGPAVERVARAAAEQAGRLPSTVVLQAGSIY